MGEVASVTLGPDGSLWALHRGDHLWNAQAFDQHEVITYKTPIAQNVVVQMHPDTGTGQHFAQGNLVSGSHELKQTVSCCGDIVLWGEDSSCGSSRRPLCKLYSATRLFQQTVSRCVMCCGVVHPLPAGKILRQWGAGHFFMPHMITVDRNNTVWIADAGRHQVLKFTSSGKFIMEAGIKNQPGPDRNKFCKPTQVSCAAVLMT